MLLVYRSSLLTRPADEEILHSLEIRDHVAIVLNLADHRNTQEFDEFVLSHQFWENIKLMFMCRIHSNFLAPFTDCTSCIIYHHRTNTKDFFARISDTSDSLQATISLPTVTGLS